MAEKFRYVITEPARLIFANITEKSAPPGTNAEPKFSGTFGLTEKDFKAICGLMVKAIESELGSFSGKADDYYMACMSSATAIRRAKAKAELDAQGKSSDEAFKIMERAENRAKLYEPYAGILTASSKFDVPLSKLEGGKIVDLDITQPHIVASAGKELFFPGAWVAPCVELQGYKRKNLDAKDGCTAFLKQVLFIRKDARLGGGAASGNDVFGGAYQGYSSVDPTALAPEEEAEPAF